MRKASVRLNHERFEAKLDAVAALCTKILNGRMDLLAAERDIALEALALQVSSYWEELVDDDFVDALNRDTTRYAEHVGITLKKDLPRDLCFGLLVGDGYLDFRNTDELIRRSRLLLVQANNPFIHMPRGARRTIDDFSILRNYVAHRSQRAYRSYTRMLSQTYNYRRIVSPGTFLRSIHGPIGRRRLFFFLDAFRRVSTAIRANARF